MNIPFNKPYLAGKELYYVKDAINLGHISANGKYTKWCQEFFQKKYGFGKCFLTTSCTDALEMDALLIKIEPGDEVILPSFTFVSTANAFALRGAKLVFVDSRRDHPGMDEDKIENLITSKTKAIVAVHYAGVACNMDIIMDLAERYDLYVVEDAAHAIDSYYIGEDGNKKALGSIGHFATFSFHETKNISSGEGGMLVLNDPKLISRAEIIWEKGTNRAAMYKGEVNKYEWIDLGSSFSPSEIIAAYLWAQLENLKKIQKKRISIWNTYYNCLEGLSSQHGIQLPHLPPFATNNAHIFYLITGSEKQRDHLIETLRRHKIYAVFHYLSLHKSPFYRTKHDGRVLENSTKYSTRLVRLPFYNTLKYSDLKIINDLLYNSLVPQKN